MKWRTALPRYSAGHRPTRVRKRTSGRTVTGRSKGSIIGGASGGASREEEEDDRMGEVRLSAGDLAVDDGYEGEWSVVQAGEEPTKYDNLAAALEEYDLEDDCAPPALPPPPPAFGEIVIQDSNDIHIGNKTFYNGSVTIKQFVFPKDEEKLGRLTSLTPESNGTLARSNAYLCDAPKVSDDGSKLDSSKEKYYIGLAEGFLEGSPKGGGGPTFTYEKKDESKLRYLKSPYVIGAAICLALVATFLIVFFVTTKPEDYDVGLGTNASERMVNRSMWKADLRNTSIVLKTPVSLVVALHTAGGPCYTLETCASKIRTIQSGTVTNGFDDLPYNFMVAGDGRIYEGRGWDLKGAFAHAFNPYSIGVGFIGTFTTVLPPKRQLDAFRLLLEEGVRLGKISADYRILLHKQVSNTESPGQKLSQELKKWPRWTDCGSIRCDKYFSVTGPPTKTTTTPHTPRPTTDNIIITETSTDSTDTVSLQESSTAPPQNARPHITSGHDEKRNSSDYASYAYLNPTQ